MPITFRCSGCDQPYRVPDEAAGRSIRCKKCDTVNTIPSPDDEDPAGDGDEDADAEPAPKLAFSRPKRKKKKGMGPMLAVIGPTLGVLGCVVLPAVGALTWWLTRGSSIDPEQYVPDHSQMIVSIRYADFIKSGAFQKIKRNSPGSAEFDKTLAESMKDSEVAPDDLEQLVFGGTTVGGEFVGIAKTKKPISAQKTLDQAKKQNRTIRETPVGRFKLYELANQPGGQAPAPGSQFGQITCFPEKYLTVTGSPTAMRSVFNRDGPAKLSEPMKKALESVNLSKTVVVVLDARIMQTLGPALGDPPGFSSIVALTLQADVRNDIRIDGVLQMQNEKSAEELLKSLDTALPKLGQNLTQEQKELLGSMKFAAKGKTVTMSMVISSAQLDKPLMSSPPKNQPQPPAQPAPPATMPPGSPR